MFLTRNGRADKLTRIVATKQNISTYSAYYKDAQRGSVKRNEGENNAYHWECGHKPGAAAVETELNKADSARTTSPETLYIDRYLPRMEVRVSWKVQNATHNVSPVHIFDCRSVLIPWQTDVT